MRKTNFSIGGETWHPKVRGQLRDSNDDNSRVSKILPGKKQQNENKTKLLKGKQIFVEHPHKKKSTSVLDEKKRK